VKTLEKLVASVAVAGLLLGGAGPALADGKDDRRGDDKGHSKKDERKNGEVDVVVKYKHRGDWKTKRYEDKSLEKAASIAKEKCHGGNWREYYRDARQVDRTGKSDKVCQKKYVRVYFEQDEDRRWDKDKGDKGKDKDRGGKK
jgi:hypothetical protein